MAEGEKEGEGTSFHGTDWEVVSLTASTYAAAPGPKGFDLPDERKNTEINRNEHASSGAMFASDCFVSSPSKHENLPIGPDYNDIKSEPGGQDGNSVVVVDDDESTKTNEDNWKIKLDDCLHETQIFDKGNKLSAQNMEFGESKILQGLDLIGEEQVIYGAPELGAFQAETNMSELVVCDDTTHSPDPNDPSHQSLDSPVEYSIASKVIEGNKDDGSGLPCEAWWKKQAISLYSHVKEANTFWSVFVAAAVVGLVLFGQRRREKLHLQQLKWQSSINIERMNQTVGPISRLKSVLVGEHGPLVRGGATSNHLGV